MNIGCARVLLGSLLALSCGHEEQRSTRSDDRNAALGGEVAARVGSESIPLTVVATVAAAQSLSPRDAVRKVVDDEVVASAARERGLDRRLPASWRLVSARARFASDRLYEAARDQGPPTNEEVALLTEKHWAEVDRPVSVRVIHAIVLRPKETSFLASARAAAEGLRAAVALASDDEFETKVKSVPYSPKLEVRVERLPPFTADGAIVDGGGRMDQVFSRAAFELASIGATSAVVETGFGFHVIRLLERLPEKRMPFESRRLAFADEVYALRARDWLTLRMKTLRRAHEVVVSPAAEQLMRTIHSSSSRETIGEP